MKLRIISTKTTILILGIYQIIGALLGFYIIAQFLLRTQEVSGTTLLILFITIGLYSLSMKAGTVLIRKKYKRGLILSLINQIFQVVAIALGGYKYDFSSGAKIAAGFNFTDGFLMKLNLQFTSEFSLAWKSGEEYFLSINLLAIFLLYLIVDIYEEIFNNKKNKIPTETNDDSEIISEGN